MSRFLLVMLACTIAQAQLTLPPPSPAPPQGQQNTLFATLERSTIPIVQFNPLPWIRLQGWPGAYYEVWACPHPPFYGQEITLYGSVDLPMFYYDFFLAWSGFIGPSTGFNSAGQSFIYCTSQPPPGIVLSLQMIVEDPINTPYGYLLSAALLIVTY